VDATLSAQQPLRHHVARMALADEGSPDDRAQFQAYFSAQLGEGKTSAGRPEQNAGLPRQINAAKCSPSQQYNLDQFGFLKSIWSVSS